MLVPTEWLSDYVEHDLSTDALAELLTMAGLEVEATAESGIGAVLDVKVTPNRGDCLSIVGLAREVMAKLGPRCRATPLWAAFQAGFGAPSASAEPEETGRLTSIKVLDETLCPRYTARVISDLRPGLSPNRVQMRLEAAGMRPINNLVDATNYVLLELGQPLHAFDMDTLAERRIVVRQARPGESFTSLDGRTHELSPPMLMICDAAKPIAIAGVMGGAETEVTDRTQTLLLESAHFDPLSVRRTRRALGIQTEAAYRFERYVDPNLVLIASYRCAALLAEWAGGSIASGALDVAAPRSPNRVIPLRLDRVTTLLGMKVELDEASNYLSRLGFSVEPDGAHSLFATVPSFRNDVTREEDLVEEIGRVHGYERIPEASLVGETVCGGLAPELAFVERVRTGLLRAGLTEAVNHSLSAPGPLQSPGDEPVALRNPMSPEFSVLRSSLLPGLVETVQRNARRGAGDLALFEIGHIFHHSGDEFAETFGAAFVITGAAERPHWSTGKSVRDFDFYDCKGIVQQLLETLNLHDQEFVAGADARFHPGRSARVIAHDVEVGFFGELHPDIRRQYDLPKRAYACALRIPKLMSLASPNYQYKPVARTQAVHRDIAFVIDSAIPWKKIASTIREACGNMLEEARLFDIYVGPGIPEGRRSLAVAITLRKLDGTLNDQEITMCLSSTMTRLQDELGAAPRT